MLELAGPRVVACRLRLVRSGLATSWAVRQDRGGRAERCPIVAVLPPSSASGGSKGQRRAFLQRVRCSPGQACRTFKAGRETSRARSHRHTPAKSAGWPHTPLVNVPPCYSPGPIRRPAPGCVDVGPAWRAGGPQLAHRGPARRSLRADGAVCRRPAAEAASSSIVCLATSTTGPAPHQRPTRCVVVSQDLDFD